VVDAGGRITVALVDDQPLFRAGIRMLIESQEDMELSGEAGDGSLRWLWQSNGTRTSS
jgi:DNA-binding NarL/FixJ family response regulator